jgi:regulator of cell morphogenesis and NO signaling
MTAITPETTLGDVVTNHPSLARELERRGLDYCCGGGRTLGEACTAQGLDPLIVAAELAAGATGDAAAPWANVDMVELVEHLEATHHRYLWDELPRLSALTEKVATVHGANHPELTDIQTCYAAIRADLEPHLLKEERVLFPMIRELAAATSAPSFHCGTLRNPINVMHDEHEVMGALLGRLRDLTDDFTPPADGCASYTALFAGYQELVTDTHLHIHKENHLLFPAVERAEARLTA